MTLPESDLGRRLYSLLPELYRNSDKLHDQHLAKYLDACGTLLDQIHNTLQQRLADSFPDNPEEPPACQDWVLPYFAQLLDVNLVSPHVAGRRDEISNAVRWRQRRGTPLVIEEVAEAIGHQAKGEAEVELHEGFQRLAITARVTL